MTASEGAGRGGAQEGGGRRPGVTRRRAVIGAAGAAAVLAGGGFAAAQLLGVDEPAAPPRRRPEWTYTPHGMRLDYVQPAVSGSTLYLATGSPARLHAVDVRTGRRRWIAEVGSTGSAYRQLGAPAVAGGTVFAVRDDGAVFAFAESDGAQRWATDPLGGQGPAVPEVFGGTVVVRSGVDRQDTETGSYVRSPGVVCGLDAASGAVRWRVPHGALLLPDRARGRVYAVAADGKHIGALDAASGQPRWTVPGGAYAAAGPEALYVLGEPRTLSAYAEDGGRRLWHARATDDSEGDYSGLAVSADGRTVYACDYSGDVRAFDARTGARRWRVRIDHPCRPVLVLRGGALFLDSGSGYGSAGGFDLFSRRGSGFVTGLAAQDGRRLWTVDRSETAWSAPVPAGRAVLVAHESAWWAYGAADGRPVWRLDAADPAPVEPPVAGGLAFLAARGAVHAVRV